MSWADLVMSFGDVVDTLRDFGNDFDVMFGMFCGDVAIPLMMVMMLKQLISLPVLFTMLS